MRSLLLLLVVALFVASATAQNAAPAVKAIRDVRIGMSIESVLSGLSERYACARLDDGEMAGSAWLVKPKNLNDDESATIVFSQAKASLITIRLYSAMTGEAVRLAERLYRLIDDRAELPTSPDRLDKVAHRRYALLPVELHDVRTDKIEDLNIGFTLGEERFSIHIIKSQGSPDTVELLQDIVEAKPKSN